MFPFKTSSIFKNRWMALLWAAGIIWFAIDVAGAPQDGSSSDAQAKQAAETLQKFSS